MAAQKEIWKLEQEVIAALVRVKPDPPVDNSVVDGGEHNNPPLFHLVRDDHRDIFSFSTAPELYGGVDVSFPISTPSTNDRGDDDGHDHDHDDDKIMSNAADTHQPVVAAGDETGDDEQAVAVYVIVDRRTMKVVYHDHIFFDLDVPYIPTYLAFREIAPLEQLVQQQIQNHPDVTPQAILVDGNGILHPRHAGIACFLGTRTDIPTIGIGKSLLYEGGWTRESVDETVDDFVKHMHATVGQNQTLASQLSRYRGLIVKRTTPPPSTAGTGNSDDPAMQDDGDVAMYHPFSSTASSAETFDRKKALQDLAPFCNGLAIPLAVSDHDSKLKTMIDEYSEATRFPVLGCALVGHGGQIAATTNSAPRGGSSKPIFVSVGHNMSSQESVQVAASLSLTRIPEPVRQADLYGREIMRQRAAAAANTKSSS